MSAGGCSGMVMNVSKWFGCISPVDRYHVRGDLGYEAECMELLPWAKWLGRPRPKQSRPSGDKAMLVSETTPSSQCDSYTGCEARTAGQISRNAPSSSPSLESQLSCGLAARAPTRQVMQPLQWHQLMLPGSTLATPPLAFAFDIVCEREWRDRLMAGWCT